MKCTGLIAGEETDRTMWRRKISGHTGDPMMGKAREKEQIGPSQLYVGFVGVGSGGNFT